MTRDAQCTIPGRAQGAADAARDEARKVNAEIDAAFGKLAEKMRGRAVKAKAKLAGAMQADRRAMLVRRFELYADAATYLEERLVRRGELPA
ncbi:hypothetical protein [Methylobacterium sp. C1]|uniref:hypothetical protein n=1 Tax=Methylobacterium sp. C1 TaxID=1479019 RepID=UPI0008D99BB4|nr:hypothetical protein [Methylobacterium sp. C1]